MDLLLLRAPSANRVYDAGAVDVASAELALLCPAVDPSTIVEEQHGGVSYLRFGLHDDADPDGLAPLGAMSQLFGLFALEPSATSGVLLRPLDLPRPDVLDADLVGIPKYPGKTNDQLTRLLLNLTLGAVDRPPGPRRVLDPLCGRGTTLTSAWTLGHDAVGVERDDRAVDALDAFLRTYLRRKRLKHSVRVSPVRREGRTLGRRLDASLTPPRGGRDLSMSVFTGDGRRSAALCGKQRFDAVVLDAPYGVVHGARTGADRAERDRSPRDLLAEGLPVWGGQLKGGGALGLAWNTVGLPREELLDLVAATGLVPFDDGPWRRLAHRVDASIRRDVLVAARPG